MWHVETAEKQTYGQCFFSITGFLGNAPLKTVSRQGNSTPLRKSTQNYQHKSATTISTSETKGIYHILDVILFCYPYGQKHFWCWDTWQCYVASDPKIFCHRSSWWTVQRKAELQNPVNTSRKNSAHTGITPHYGSSLPWISVSCQQFTNICQNLNAVSLPHLKALFHFNVEKRGKFDLL